MYEVGVWEVDPDGGGPESPFEMDRERGPPLETDGQGDVPRWKVVGLGSYPGESMDMEFMEGVDPRRCSLLEDSL